MTRVGPVSATETLRAQRKAAPFRPLPEGPPMLTKVTFADQETQPRRTPPLEIPAPPPISLGERLDLGRPMGNTTALVAAAMTASLPDSTVTLHSYLQAQVRAYT